MAIGYRRGVRYHGRAVAIQPLPFLTFARTPTAMNSMPLAGVRVLELARILAGPWAGQLLADLAPPIPFGEGNRLAVAELNSLNVKSRLADRQV